MTWIYLTRSTLLCRQHTENTGNPFHRLYFSHTIWPGSASSCLFTCWGGYYIHYETPDTRFKILDGTAAGMIYQSSQFVQKALTCSPHCGHLRTDPNARVLKARRFQAARRLLECRYTCTYQDGGSFVFLTSFWDVIIDISFMPRNVSIIEYS